MSLNLLLSVALSQAETLLNKALALDPATQIKLLELNGQNIAVRSIHPQLAILIAINEQGVSLSPLISDITDQVDAEISGPAKELIKLLLTKEKSNIIRNQKIQLKGDITSIQALQNIFLKLDIDWEYHLSKLLGDVPTQTFSDGMAFLKNFINSSTSSLQNSVDEYIHEESNLFPSSNELERFYQRIDSLRLRLDRNQARINKFVTN
jgi:ubiquinone biosynthesis protein UbiJ